MISVCVATYNGEKYIVEQLESILHQLGEDDEIIISDDDSTDTTLDLIRDLNEPRIKVFKHTKISYPNVYDYTTHNFEYALSKAKGDLIFLADQDDVWLPDKVNVMCEYLENNILVLSDCAITDQYLSVKYESYFRINNSTTGVLRNIVRNSFLGSCMAFRKELLAYAFPFPPSGVAHDIWLGLLATTYGQVAFISKPLILYRRYSGTVSPSGGGKNTLSFMFKIIYRIKIIAYLIFNVYEKKAHPSYL